MYGIYHKVKVMYKIKTKSDAIFRLSRYLPRGSVYHRWGAGNVKYRGGVTEDVNLITLLPGIRGLKLLD